MNINKIILNLLLITPPICTEISFTDIKGMYNDIIDGKKHLSPAHGFNWFKTGIIENMYRYGDENDATIKLVKELFFLQPDGVTFDTTHVESKPASRFTPVTIGKILNYIENNPAISKPALRAIIAQDIGSVKDQINALNKKINVLNKDMGRLKKTDDSEVKQQTLELLEASKTHLSHQIKQLEKQKLPVQSKSFDALITAIEGCLKESTHQYPPHTLHNILLSFAWKKAAAKQDFWDYFAQFNPAILPASLDRASWINTSYNRNDYETFIAEITQSPAAILKDYELSSFSSYGNSIWAQPYPPIISGSQVEYAADDATKYSFSDCGETSIRNFFDIILFNPETKTFDISYLLGKEDVTPSAKLVNYYTTHNQASAISTRSYYDDWTQVVSGLPGIAYRRNNVCEITGNETMPRLNNVLNLLNHILFGDSENFKKKSTQEKLDYLTQAISRDDFKITWDLVAGELDKNAPTVLRFTVRTPRDSYSFTWIFNVGHFVIPPIMLQSSSLQKQIVDQLNTNIISNLPSFYLLGWYANIIAASLVDLRQAGDSYILLFIFMTPLKNNDFKKMLIEWLLDNNEIKENLIINLAASLPNDEFVFEKIVTILGDLYSSHPQFVKAFIEQLMLKKPILTIIALKSIRSLYPYITTENLNKLDPYSLKSIIVRIICPRSPGSSLLILSAVIDG